jgi:hypothetical protein
MASAEAAVYEHIEWTKLADVGNSFAADSLEALLRSFDIPVLVKPAGAGGYMEVYMGFTRLGVDVYVPQEDFERANEIFQAYANRDYKPADGDSDEEMFAAGFDEPVDEMFAATFDEPADEADSDPTTAERKISLVKWVIRIFLIISAAGLIFSLLWNELSLNGSIM